jgi:multiple sugar transport system ATP-binding protein
MAGVEFAAVRKTFGPVVAVEGLDLAIADGAFVSLLGPSGCGKTTTLRMLAGLEFPSRGTITIGDRVVNDVAPGKRDVAMVFQSYALYPHMSVAENLAYPLRKRGVPRGERDAKVRAVAATLQLDALLDRRPRQLSGGQQQRVALGRALVRNPQVFLFDEPLSNLDAKLRAHMRAELIELRQKIGQTMVYVTHDQLEAMTMSDRIAVMRNGVLLQYGTPAEIYHSPANLFVAGFIGTPSMNFIEGELARAGERTVFRTERLAVELPTGLLRDEVAPAGLRRVVFGMRPEDVIVSDEGFGAQVKVVEPTGHESIVVFDLAGERVVARVPADVSVRRGEPVRLTLRTRRAYLFDRATEESLTAPRRDARERPVGVGGRG